jgi:hypothetical protein
MPELSAPTKAWLGSSANPEMRVPSPSLEEGMDFFGQEKKIFLVHPNTL